MNRYGDTPLGMVESALEFLRIARAHDYHALMLSMKSSNPKVMIQAYRLLVERMDQEDMHYPLHLGVTEAGDGEDGRIKSAIGIGSLLLDGLGDTIRVSLTEDSVYEIPVARAIAEKAMSLWRGDNTERPTFNVQPSTSAPQNRDEWRASSADASGAASTPQRGNAEHLGSATLEVGSSKLNVERSAPATDSIDPYHFTRRETAALQLSTRCAVGPEQPPRVIVRSSLAGLAAAAKALSEPKMKDTPAEGLLVRVDTPSDLANLADTVRMQPLPVEFLVVEAGPLLTAADVSPMLLAEGGRVMVVRRFGAGDAVLLKEFASAVRAKGHFLAVDAPAEVLAALAPALGAMGDDGLVYTLSATAGAEHATGAYRRLIEFLRKFGSQAPVWIRNTAATAVHDDKSFLSKLLEASFLTGGLLCDGLGDFVSIETEADPARSTRLAYNVLQGAGARISKTEFVACPSCGRTLFDLQTTTQRIRAQTGHLKGVKIAIMGYIVNGPGEMADADFGYVGGAPGKINLYVGKNCVQYNIPQAEADGRLVALIREHGKWADPEPHQLANA
jgi:(E)-4-hydroxy-3-methylbut-2-enyl-diphosphate synthase